MPSSSSNSSSDSDVSSRGSSRRSRVRSGRVREPARQIPIERDEEERIQNPRPAKRRREEESVRKFKLSKSRGRRLLRPFSKGVGTTESKVIRGRYLMSFKKRSTSFKCPSLDDALYQRLKQVKGSSASKNTIDQNERALYSVQQKILEAAQPLFFLSNEKLNDNDHRQAISDALQLLADSFHEVTQQRRRNVLKQTSPSYLYLLDDQTISIATKLVPSLEDHLSDPWSDPHNNKPS